MTILAVISVGVSGVFCLIVVLIARAFGRSFGQYTRRIEQSNERTRQSCEESAQRVMRTERRIADDEMATIELVREMMKSYHQERSA